MEQKHYPQKGKKEKINYQDLIKKLWDKVKKDLSLYEKIVEINKELEKKYTREELQKRKIWHKFVASTPPPDTKGFDPNNEIDKEIIEIIKSILSESEKK